MNLNDITNYIQNVCENISSIIEVDVTLVSKDLTRLAGTGIFKEKIGEKIPKKTIYYNVLKEGKSYVINKDLEDNCNQCCNRLSCKELADICTPVKFENCIVGVLGIAAFDEIQKNKILTKDKELIDFINSMSDLISFKLNELYKQEIKTIEQLEKEAIENAIKKYGNNTEGMKKVAEALNIGIATLYRKIKKFDIKY
ncbi:helix-turn-helix domain-containing protein [Romboutsia sp.]|uniref:helix-turn-helix domain-containing protein n=1 Tax=Romboutsia sp. TaxID=1965302 RepID=UPI002B7543E2|nr:helix-turn-helix domain-containing protein [Romboutsia sp.]HSQ88250.1 helix-turn-helix domain-containing protein [Romboutsia sp.]